MKLVIYFAESIQWIVFGSWREEMKLTDKWGQRFFLKSGKWMSDDIK